MSADCHIQVKSMQMQTATLQIHTFIDHIQKLHHPYHLQKQETNSLTNITILSSRTDLVEKRKNPHKKLFGCLPELFVR